MVNRMRPGADRALKDGRRRGLYTVCGAASNRREPQLDKIAGAIRFTNRQLARPYGNLILSGSSR